MGYHLKTLPNRISTSAPRLQPATTETQRTRGNAWTAIRNRILRRDCGMCQQCKREGRARPAAQVDHITPLFEGGTDAGDNLQSLCIPCHDAKSAAEDQRRRGQQ